MDFASSCYPAEFHADESKFAQTVFIMNTPCGNNQRENKTDHTGIHLLAYKNTIEHLCYSILGAPCVTL